jgi:hypothetical protein
MFENISKGEFYVEKNVGYGKDTHCVCVKNQSDKIKFPMRKPDAYYTDFMKSNGGTILSTELALKNGNYVATEQIKKELNEQEKQNSEFISFCFNIQQKYDISKFEECIKMLEKAIEINKAHKFNGHLINNQIERFLKQVKK